MSILEILRAKTPATADALRAKLTKLQNLDPLAGRAELEAERREALLAGKDDRVTAIDAEIQRMTLDSQRKELACEQLHREIVAAEQAEADERRTAAVKKAKQATKQTRALLDRRRQR